MGEKEHRKPREIFKILLEKFESMKIDTFVAKLLKVDPEIRSDELTMLFAYIDMDNDGLISFTQLEAVLNLDDVAGNRRIVTELLQSKYNPLNPPPLLRPLSLTGTCKNRQSNSNLTTNPQAPPTSFIV